MVGFAYMLAFLSVVLDCEVLGPGTIISRAYIIHCLVILLIQMIKTPDNAWLFFFFLRVHIIVDLGYTWQSEVTSYVVNFLFLFYFYLWGI